jgi:hypothetical protein
MTVPAYRVMKYLDVIKNILPCLNAVCIDTAPYTFSFEELKKALHHGVVTAVASPAHTGNEVVLI